jgi:hypothetical protein
MRLANVVAAGVEPQVGVAMPFAVLFAVVQHTFQHIGNGAIVTAAVAGCQDNNVFIPRRPRIAAPAVGVLGYVPVPFWLSLEVARLRDVVVGDNGCYRFAGHVSSIVFDGYVAVKSEEDNNCCDGRNGK